MSTYYSPLIFKKEVNQIKREDLESFFSTRQDESDILEFKSGEKEVDELFKEICAFLNTNGGLLIYGAPHEKKDTNTKDNVKYCFGELVPTRLVKSTDQLFQRLASNIQPLGMDIKIGLVSTELGNIFIFDIPKSQYAPHQWQGTYYIRFDKQSRPAPHGFVEALFNKRQVPLLRTYTNIKNANTPEGIQEYHDIVLSVQNESNHQAENVGICIQVVGDVWIDPDDFTHTTIEFNHDSSHKLLKSFTAFRKGGDTPLVKGLSINIKFRIVHKAQKYWIQSGTFSKESSLIQRDFVIDPPSIKEEVNDNSLFIYDSKSCDATHDNFTNICSALGMPPEDVVELFE